MDTVYKTINDEHIQPHELSELRTSEGRHLRSQEFIFVVGVAELTVPQERSSTATIQSVSLRTAFW